MTDQKEFFDRLDTALIETSCGELFTVEELYQAFKERLILDLFKIEGQINEPLGGLRLRKEVYALVKESAKHE